MIAQELVELGCSVVIASRKVPVLEAAAKKLTAAAGCAGRVFFRRCDIRDEAQVQGLIRFALEKFERLDFVVNNGGGQFPSPAVVSRPHQFISLCLWIDFFP